MASSKVLTLLPSAGAYQGSTLTRNSLQDAVSSRPNSQHRLSVSSAQPTNIPGRPASRQHSHSISLGAMNSQYRVTRRKSMVSNAGNNVSAMAAALREASEHPYSSSASSHRRSMNAKKGVEAGMSDANVTTAGPSKAQRTKEQSPEGQAVAEGHASAPKGASNKSRNRRASEGSHLIRGEGKRLPAGELRCEKCGKGYKHSSCLTKHLCVYLYPHLTHFHIGMALALKDAAKLFDVKPCTNFYVV